MSATGQAAPNRAKEKRPDDILGGLPWPSWLREADNIWTTTLNGVTGGVLRNRSAIAPTTFTAFVCKENSVSDVFAGRGALQRAQAAVVRKLMDA
jgi:hypothetical protein